jgi:hypothetical protein
MVAVQNVKIDFSTETKRMMERLTRAIEANTRLANTLPAVEEGHHDHDTMDKVREAIERAYPGPDDPGTIATAIISELQNAGILFRERR